MARAASPQKASGSSRLARRRSSTRAHRRASVARRAERRACTPGCGIVRRLSAGAAVAPRSQSPSSTLRNRPVARFDERSPKIVNTRRVPSLPTTIAARVPSSASEEPQPRAELACAGSRRRRDCRCRPVRGCRTGRGRRSRCARRARGRRPRRTSCGAVPAPVVVAVLLDRVADAAHTAARGRPRRTAPRRRSRGSRRTSPASPASARAGIARAASATAMVTRRTTVLPLLRHRPGSHTGTRPPSG